MGAIQVSYMDFAIGGIKKAATKRWSRLFAHVYREQVYFLPANSAAMFAQLDGSRNLLILLVFKISLYRSKLTAAMSL